MIHRPARHALAAILALALAACGADTKTGSNGTGLNPQSEPAVFAGALTDVEPFAAGGTALDLAVAAVRVDAQPAAGTAGLRLGMPIEGNGGYNGGIAPSVAVTEASAQETARGTVTAVDAARGAFSVATLTFLVDANTLYDGVAGFAALAPGQPVAVWALPTADLRTQRATRIAAAPGLAPGRLTVSVRVESTNAGTFQLAGLTVTFPAFSPSPPAFVGRARVTGTLNAAAGTLTDDEVIFLPDFPPAAGTRAEIEGTVLSPTATGGFVLRTAARDYTIETVPGAPVAPSPGDRVRVTSLANSATVLRATSVALVNPATPQAYRVTGTVSGFVSLANLRVRGEPVDLSTAIFSGGTAADVANGRRLSLVGTAGPGALRVTTATILP
jgi:hypothetical protein